MTGERTGWSCPACALPIVADDGARFQIVSWTIGNIHHRRLFVVSADECTATMVHEIGPCMGKVRQ
jgi:hypothetical protein